MPAIEHLDSNSWQIDSVFVDLYGLTFIGDEKVIRSFWIGIDRGRPERFNKDVVQVTKQVIAENTDLGIQMDRVIDYMYPLPQFDYGLQHTGLFFTWKWTFTDRFGLLDGLQPCHFEEAGRRSLHSIARLIALLKSKGLPLSEQQPYSAKNTWLNHFRPTVEHLMNFGSDFWLPALTLTIPCIDAAYQDWYESQHGKDPGRRYTGHMLRWVFDPDNVYANHESLNKAICLLQVGLANGLKHDTLIRKPIALYNPYLRHTFSDPPDFAFFSEGDETKTIFSIRVDPMGAESVMVFPTMWWETVRNKIDRHYNLL